MQTKPYWLADDESPRPALHGDHTADAVVIGGGISGLTAAQLLAARGMEVIVLERTTCGAGATGRSSGFITPDSELQAAQLLRRFEARDAGRLWRAASKACEHVRRTIREYEVDCDLVEADSVYIASDRTGRSTISREHESRLELGLPSTHYYDVSKFMNAAGYDSAVRYGGTFGITPYRYVRALRDALRVRVYENSPVVSAADEIVATPHGRVRTGAIFFCADHDLARVGNARRAAHHVQTFLAATKPLHPDRFRKLFPDGDLLVWDTDLIYQYFRRTADDRLLIGGGRLRTTYGPPAKPDDVIEHLRKYIEERLPILGDVTLSHAWSGFIGVTKDFLPIAGRDDRRVNHFYAGCGAGIPWSVLAAQCAVASMDGATGFEPFFDPRRAFTDLDPLQSIAGKPVTFALSHGYAKGLLRGSSADVKRRRPFLLAVAVIAIISAVVRFIAGRRK